MYVKISKGVEKMKKVLKLPYTPYTPYITGKFRRGLYGEG